MECEATKDYYEVLLLCYSQDEELLKKYHRLAPVKLMDAIKDTADMFNDINIISSCCMYKVFHNDKFVGYFFKEQNNAMESITGFFVMPEYRTREHIPLFWDAVLSQFGETVYCGIWENNTRARKFIERKGFVLHKQYFKGLVFKLKNVIS